MDPSAGPVNQTSSSEAKIALFRTDGVIECSVSDNGTGILADHLNTVFDKGEGDADKEGSIGLGLAIMKTLR